MRNSGCGLGKSTEKCREGVIMSGVPQTCSQDETGLFKPSPVFPSSCLQKPRKNADDDSCAQTKVLTKEVSFPEDDSQLVTGFMEAPNPWEHAEDVDREKLISSYSSSCIKHGHRASPGVLKQLETVHLDGDRCEYLSLKGEILDPSHCESLEEVFKRVQFITLDLEDTSLDDEGAVALFDMIEYYEAAIKINISCNRNISMRGWQACSRMIKKMFSLEHLEARSVPLNEQYMPVLSRALRITPHLQVLKLEDCALSGRPVIILVAALKINTGLRELYLCDNDLGINDAIQLGALLRANNTLTLLDVSNNDIQDAGAGHIADGVADQGEQLPPRSGLIILVLWNNHLTRNSSTHFARALVCQLERDAFLSRIYLFQSRSRSLEMLNIGHNALSNEVLHVLKDSLQQNRSLLRLGMQSTHLSCEGAIALAEIIEDNPVIQRIDLRDNKILVAGLLALALSMKNNTSVTQLDLDDAPKKKLPEDVTIEEYNRLVNEIRSFCARNESVPQATEEEDEELSELSDNERRPNGRRMYLTSVNSRKISLTCQTLLRTVAQDNGMLLVEPRRTGGRLRSPAPSPVPSPVSSPMPSPAPSPGPARSRFRVSQVSESDSLSQSPSPSASPSTSPTCFFPSASSRFKVTVVEPPVSVIVTNNVPTMGFSYEEEQGQGAAKEPVHGDRKTTEENIPKGESTPEADFEVSRLMEGAAETSPDWKEVAHPKPVVPTPDAVPPPSPAAKTQSPRIRKISWVGSSPLSASSDEQKTPSGLERLLGLFNYPSSLFNKAPVNPPSPSKPAQMKSGHGDTEPGATCRNDNDETNERICYAPNDDKDDCDTWKVSSEAQEAPAAEQRDILNNNNQSDGTPSGEGIGEALDGRPAHQDENLNITRSDRERRGSREEGSSGCLQECVRVEVRVRNVEVCDKADCGDDRLMHSQIADHLAEQVRKDEDVEKVKVDATAVGMPTVTSAPPIPTSMAL